MLSDFRKESELYAAFLAVFVRSTYFAQGLNSVCLSWILVPLQNTGTVRLGFINKCG